VQAIHILHLISSAGLLGAERVLLELALETKQAGFKVTIGVFRNTLNPNLAIADAAEELGLEVKIFPCDGRLDKNTIQIIKDYMDKAGVQILHSHNYKSNFYARKALQNKNVRWVVSNHGRRFGLKILLYAVLDAFVIKHADKIIAVSENIFRKVRRAGIDTKKICIIENGINFDRFNENKFSISAKESLGIEKFIQLISDEQW